jgi:WD40 repeat protein
VAVNRLVVGNAAATDLLLSSSADRRLNVMRPGRPMAFLQSFTQIENSPILAWHVIADRYILAASMSGKVALFDAVTQSIISTRQDHTKYVVSIACWHQQSHTIVATAAWDGRVNIYALACADSEPSFPMPYAKASLPTIPEAILFVAHPETSQPILLVTRRDSTFIYYFLIPEPVSAMGGEPSELQLLGKQNLAPHSHSWVAFTPSCIKISPKDPSVVAIATSTTPHMKLMIVRLLMPPIDVSGSFTTSTEPITQAAQARAELATQDREEAAIIVSCNTFAMQTLYSSPLLAWRPNGSGVWVNSDDGVIRGIEARSGKVVSTLKGHDAGAKVRCIWAGEVTVNADDEQKTEEWLVSGGFDQKLIVWKPE